MKPNAMELNEQNLEMLAGSLRQTLSPDINERKPAEKALESIESHKGYAVLLLHLMDKDGLDQAIRISSAVTFKNFVKRNWRVVSVFYT